MTGVLRRVIVCRTDAIGDTILTLPVCQAIKQQWPQCSVTFLVSPYTYDLFKNLPDIDAMPYHVEQNNGEIIKSLKQKAFDTAVIVYPDKRLSWLLWRAGVPCRIGTGRRWWSFLYNRKVNHSRKKAIKHEAAYNLDLIAPLGLPPRLIEPVLVVDREEHDEINRQLANIGIGSEDQFVLVHPGGRGSSANWTVDAYARLVGLLSDKKIKTVISGTTSEHTLMETVLHLSKKYSDGVSNGHAVLFNREVPLNLFKALVARSRVLVCGNTGPMHIASAVGTPVVAVFPEKGVTGPVRWGPLGNKATVFSAAPVTGASRSGITEKQIDPEAVAEKVLDYIS